MKRDGIIHSTCIKILINPFEDILQFSKSNNDIGGGFNGVCYFREVYFGVERVDSKGVVFLVYNILKQVYKFSSFRKNLMKLTTR